MKLVHRPAACLSAAAVLICAAAAAAAAEYEITAPDATGLIGTYTADGVIDTTNPFFQSLGTNGRSCSTCHRADTAWTVAPAGLRARFDLGSGIRRHGTPPSGLRTGSLSGASTRAPPALVFSSQPRL